MLKRFFLNKTVQFLFFAVSLAVVILVGTGASSTCIASRGSCCRGSGRGAFLFIIDSTGCVNFLIIPFAGIA